MCFKYILLQSIKVFALIRRIISRTTVFLKLRWVINSHALSTELEVRYVLGGSVGWRVEVEAPPLFCSYFWCDSLHRPYPHVYRHRRWRLIEHVHSAFTPHRLPSPPPPRGVFWLANAPLFILVSVSHHLVGDGGGFSTPHRRLFMLGGRATTPIFLRA